MRLVFRIVVGLLLLLSHAVDAHAAYDARLLELQARLKAKPIEDVAERARLEQFTNAVIDNRNTCLTRLVELVADSSVGKTQADAWKSRIEQARTDLKSIADGTSSAMGQNPSIGAITYFSSTVTEEDRFLEDLTAVNTAAFRDSLLANAAILTQARQNLELKWQALLEQDAKLDDAERAIATELEAVIDNTIEKLTYDNQLAKEKLADWALAAAKVVKLLPDQELVDVLGKLLEDYVNDNEARRKRLGNYQVLVMGEQAGVYPTFLDSRRDTTEFIANNGFEQAKAQYAKAKDALDMFSARLPAPAQREDASAFKTEVLARLEVDLTRAQSEFNEFVSRHRGRFFGPIDDATLDSLAEGVFWKNEWDVLNKRNLDSKLIEWRRLTQNWWDVNLSAISAADLADLKSKTESRINELVKQLEDEQRLGVLWAAEAERAKNKGQTLK